MSDTYSVHAHICAKFYELNLDAQAVARFVFERSGSVPGQMALFVGGMFEVAAALSSLGLDLTVVDYTDEMVEVGKLRLPQCNVTKADLRALPFHEAFDTVFVVGRVFTHMVTNEDLTAALASCRRALKPQGRLFADNYEDSRIQVTDYFNGTIEAKDNRCTIVRVSTTERLSGAPYVVNWRAEYAGVMDGTPFRFSDSIEHRAFSRAEFADHAQKVGLEVLSQGDNFDDTSFYTLSQRSV